MTTSTTVTSLTEEQNGRERKRDCQPHLDKERSFYIDQMISYAMLQSH